MLHPLPHVLPKLALENVCIWGLVHRFAIIVIYMITKINVDNEENNEKKEKISLGNYILNDGRRERINRVLKRESGKREYPRGKKRVSVTGAHECPM